MKIIDTIKFNEKMFLSIPPFGRDEEQERVASTEKIIGFEFRYIYLNKFYIFTMDSYTTIIGDKKFVVLDENNKEIIMERDDIKAQLNRLWNGLSFTSKKVEKVYPEGCECLGKELDVEWDVCLCSNVKASKEEINVVEIGKQMSEMLKKDK